jgi:hypothetical protein
LYQQDGLLLVLLTQITPVHVSFTSFCTSLQELVHDTTMVSARRLVVPNAHTSAALPIASL